MDSEIQYIKYEAGNPHFRGKTIIEIKEDRTVIVSFKQNNHSKRYSNKIDKRDQKRLFEKIETVDPCSFSSQKEFVEPDDIEVCLTVKYPQKKCKLKFWGSERFEFKSLNELVNSLNKLASETSDGAITY